MKVLYIIALFEMAFLGIALSSSIIGKLKPTSTPYNLELFAYEYIKKMSEENQINHTSLTYIFNRFENYINGYFDEAEYDAIISVVNAVRINNAN